MAAAKTIHFPSGVSTYGCDAAEYKNERVSFNGKSYYTVTACDGEYGMYYLNSTGGMDAFLYQGKCKRTDNYAQYEYYRDYDTGTIDPGRNRYVTEITPSWELHTGWLTEDQAANMVLNLFPSTQVYIHDLAEGRIMPVVITDTKAEYKTRRNNGKQLIQYTVNCKAAQDMARR